VEKRFRSKQQRESCVDDLPQRFHTKEFVVAPRPRGTKMAARASAKKTALILGLVSGAKLAPQGRLRKAQGASPGNKHSNKGSPEGAMQLVPVPKRRLMTSIYLELRSNSLRRPFRAFRNLALEPR